GIMRGGEALDLPEVATTLSAGRNDQPTIQDGPFADTKEQLGGFFIIEVDHLDDAILWASRCPAIRGGKVEIRPTTRPGG
ncbi:MAG: YciI family protein, partial [Myxococcota bacterium]